MKEEHDNTKTTKTILGIVGFGISVTSLALFFPFGFFGSYYYIIIPGLGIALSTVGLFVKDSKKVLPILGISFGVAAIALLLWAGLIFWPSVTWGPAPAPT